VEIGENDVTVGSGGTERNCEGKDKGVRVRGSGARADDDAGFVLRWIKSFRGGGPGSDCDSPTRSRWEGRVLERRVTVLLQDAMAAAPRCSGSLATRACAPDAVVFFMRRVRLARLALCSCRLATVVACAVVGRNLKESGQ
jgi:hypothetical protein